MKQFIKQIIKKILPNQLIDIIINLKQLNNIQQLNNKIEHIQEDVKRTKINTELLFDYTAGFSGLTAERQIVNNYNDAQVDHIVRYQLFAQIVKKGDKVLDCASGVGYGSAYLNDHTEASSIIGGDIDQKVVEFCQKIFGKPSFVWKENAVSFQQLDIRDTSAFAEGSFDKICSFETIEHVPNEVAEVAFQNIYYWLKEGGVCYCSVPNNDIHPHPSPWSPFHFRHYTPSEFQEALEKVGFSKVSIKYYNSNGELFDEMTSECYGTILAICEK